MFSKIYILYILFMNMYTKAFLLHLVRAWENIKKKEEMEKLENTQLNASTEYEKEKVKQAK